MGETNVLDAPLVCLLVPYRLTPGSIRMDSKMRSIFRTRLLFPSTNKETSVETIAIGMEHEDSIIMPAGKLELRLLSFLYVNARHQAKSIDNCRYPQR